MIWQSVLLAFCIATGGLPALLVLRNRARFRLPPKPSAPPATPPRVSVLIPARDEAASISASLNAALQNRDVEIEVLVLDDASQDATPDIVRAVADRDSRVRLLQAPQLPEGWNGKQHACARLAEAAQFENLLFIDADVRLSSDAIARLVAARDRTDVALLSAFPHQETGTFWERLLIPLMHYILLGFLPLDQMRSSTNPAFAAGCGQLFLTDAERYRRAGTHAAIRSSRHDGVRLPRAYRTADLSTDVYDGCEIATCRMYTSAAQVLRGLLKNADEGIANARLIVPFSVLLLGGNVISWLACLLGVLWMKPLLMGCGLAGLAAWLPRIIAAREYRQSWLGVLFHPLAIAAFVTIQWWAFVNSLLGRRVAWRGRTES